ncbi:hypothetical protein B0H14DRAFT_2616899 [Mycena olivaceomarginata]|nr:hypothetical protein B0H14DRAFT_2616899 [Mycena olivaceomarginata]
MSFEKPPGCNGATLLYMPRKPPRLLQVAITNSLIQHTLIWRELHTTRTGPISGKQAHTNHPNPHSKCEPISPKIRPVPSSLWPDFGLIALLLQRVLGTTGIASGIWLSATTWMTVASDFRVLGATTARRPPWKEAPLRPARLGSLLNTLTVFGHFPEESVFPSPRKTRMRLSIFMIYSYCGGPSPRFIDKGARNLFQRYAMLSAARSRVSRHVLLVAKILCSLCFVCVDWCFGGLPFIQGLFLLSSPYNLSSQPFWSIFPAAADLQNSPLAPDGTEELDIAFSTFYLPANTLATHNAEYADVVRTWDDSGPRTPLVLYAYALCDGASSSPLFGGVALDFLAGKNASYGECAR